jgi:hypothetical protein
MKLVSVWQNVQKCKNYPIQNLVEDIAFQVFIYFSNIASVIMTEADIFLVDFYVTLFKAFLNILCERKQASDDELYLRAKELEPRVAKQ